DRYRRASPRMVCEIDDVLIAFEVGFTGPNILDVGNLFGPLNSSKAAFRMRTDHLAAPHCKLRWRIVKRNATEGFAVIKVQRAEPGLANPCCVFEYSPEYRLQVA